jgi:hypothetical protein
VDPVPPSPESQEDEVDREDDEISVAPGSQERVFLDEEESDHPTEASKLEENLLGLGREAKGIFATSLMMV